MKRVAFIVLLSIAQILECQSFDFRNLFGSYAKAAPNPSSKDIQISSSSSKLAENDKKLENESLSFTEDKNQDLNTSLSSISEMLHTVDAKQQDIANISSVNAKLIDLALNGTENKDNVLEIKLPTSTEKFQAVTVISTESITASNQVLNETVSSSSNVTVSTEEPEEVVLEDRPSIFTYVTKTMYQKTADFMGDPYTLSIFIPIAAGVLFALAVIITIATCRCIKRKCRRRRFRKRVLPDSIKSLRPSDQARLLGDCCDSSDEF